MDPSHIPYAHKGLNGQPSKPEDPGRVEHDREGGGPMKLKIEEASKEGYLASTERGQYKFIAPCTYHSSGISLPTKPGTKKKASRFMIVVFCIPVGPGRSRLIWAFPRNFGVWLSMVVPRWVYHMGMDNRVLDSDAYILHVEERKFAAMGLENWQSRCYVPASSDAMVVAFRSWYRKHSKNQVGWATPQPGGLPPTDTRDRVMDRYWSHVEQCTSCSAALKAIKALEVTLQVASVAVVGFLAVAKGTLVTSTAQRAAVVSAAVLCFAASRWLASFIQKHFYFHDYIHAYK